LKPRYLRQILRRRGGHSGYNYSAPLEHQAKAYKAIHDAVVADGDHRDASQQYA
jgi:hypothetical protein